MSGTDSPHGNLLLKNLEKHDQAGGHAGVLRSGSLIIKPCTQAEIDFYALANEKQALFAAWMPTYMGQLTLGKPGTSDSISAGSAANTVLESERFDTAIVLENIEWGFKRPSVLDIKLGKVLTDEKVSEEKRVRLEKVSMSTTSWENHLRLTGMRVCVSPFFGFDLAGVESAYSGTYCLSKDLWTNINDRDITGGVLQFLRFTNKPNP
jgi:1D-myo-inositol-tetrakisphosphate 5-kinase/inositol-polyphosphate multikinase